MVAASPKARSPALPVGAAGPHPDPHVTVGAMSCWKSLPPWDEEGPRGPRTLPSGRDMQGQGRELVLPWVRDACSSARSVRELLGLIGFPSPVKPQ